MAKMSVVKGKAAAVAAAAAPAAPNVDQATLDRVAEETVRMGRTDRVFHWDKRQGAKVWAGADDKILTPEQIQADEDADAQYVPVFGQPRGPRNRHHLVRSPEVMLCAYDKDHGPLVINGAGSTLLCCAHKNGAPCTYNQPVSL